MKEKVSVDPYQDVNSRVFLETLLGGGPKAQRAFAELFRATHERILNYIRRYLGSVEESQEVLQETYLAVHKGLSRFEGKAKLTTWIFSLAYHKTCDRLSEKDRGHLEFKEEQVFLATDEPASDVLFRDISPWDAASDAVAEKRVLEGLIARAIEGLPPSFRHVYHLRDEEGLSGEEIAAMLAVPSSTVRVHLHRARSMIVQAVRAELERKRSGSKVEKCRKTEVAGP